VVLKEHQRWGCRRSTTTSRRLGKRARVRSRSFTSRPCIASIYQSSGTVFVNTERWGITKKRTPLDLDDGATSTFDPETEEFRPRLREGARRTCGDATWSAVLRLIFIVAGTLEEAAPRCRDVSMFRGGTRARGGRSPGSSRSPRSSEARGTEAQIAKAWSESSCATRLSSFSEQLMRKLAVASGRRVIGGLPATSSTTIRAARGASRCSPHPDGRPLRYVAEPSHAFSRSSLALRHEVRSGRPSRLWPRIRHLRT